MEDALEKNCITGLQTPQHKDGLMNSNLFILFFQQIVSIVEDFLFRFWPVIIILAGLGRDLHFYFDR